MKKNYLVFCFLYLLGTTIQAQRWDAGWVIGNDDTAEDTGGGTLLDFSTGNLQTYFIPKHFASDAANAAMCDKNGKIQFYTNGCVIANADHEMMENGDIQIGTYTDEFCANGSLNYSSRVPQSIIALPNFKYDNLYFVISQKLDLADLNDTTTVIGTKLYLNIIDMNQNQGLGKVVGKHIEIINDTLNSENLQAIPHANGHDWWIVIPKVLSNCYDVILLDAEGNTKVTQQCLGNSFGVASWLGQAAFSPDGTKFVRFHWKYGLNLFDFDRCSGIFSNPQAVNFPDISFLRAGCAFSGSGRYLYATTHTKLFQFDVQAADIAASRIHIADYDGFNTPYNTKFYMADLAPDGKIYIGCPGQSQHIHVINEPDQAGADCNFRQHDVALFTSNFWSFPNLAHTRLGPIDGSACDTLGLNNMPWANWRWNLADSLQPLTVRFTDLSAYEVSSGHWDFGDGSESNEMNPTHHFTSEGIYNVCLYVQNANGADTLCRALDLRISSLETPVASAAVIMMPNPFQQWLQIRVQADLKDPVFYLYDQFGRLFIQKTITGGAARFETGALPAGIYFWQITSAGGDFWGSGKLLKGA